MDEHDLLGDEATCTNCEHGWVHAKEAFVRQHAHDANPDPTSMAHRSALAVARNMVYPCRVCRRAAFFRWAQKHWEPDHDRAGCVECEAGMPGKRRTRRRVDPPVRADTDG